MAAEPVHHAPALVTGPGGVGLGRLERALCRYVYADAGTELGSGWTEAFTPA
jgi:hypothetical protein